MLSIRKVSDSPLGSSPLGSDGPLGPSPLGSVGVLDPNLREHSHSESMAMMIITMISTRIDTQKRMGGDTALWLIVLARALQRTGCEMDRILLHTWPCASLD